MSNGSRATSLVEDLFAPLIGSKVAGAVVGVFHPESGLVKAFGNSGTERPLDQKTIFEIGSITKVFTAILLADMSERGEVALDDPIGVYLPAHVTGPSRAGREVTLIDLVTHTAGLPRMPRNVLPNLLRNRANPYADYSRNQLYKAVDERRVKSIGKKVRYSNFGFGLLGHLLERAAGIPYEDLVVNRVCHPLSLDDTRIEVTGEGRERLAQGHKGRKPVQAWDLPTLAGAGALRSTAADMLRFIEANLRPERTPLAKALLNAKEPRRQMRGKMEICMAWLRTRSKSGRWLTWHNGGTGGFGSFVGFHTESNTGVVVLSNSRMTMRLNATSMRLLDELGSSSSD